MKTVYSILYIGTHLISRLIRRLFGIRSPGLKEFRSFYQADRILPYSKEEKILTREFSNCIQCGLCDLGCRALATFSQEIFLPPSFLSTLTRSIPDFSGLVETPYEELCGDIAASEALCPTKVPIRKMIEFLKRK